jgi:hypothetical protein
MPCHMKIYTLLNNSSQRQIQNSTAEFLENNGNKSPTMPDSVGYNKSTHQSKHNAWNTYIDKN